jgi:DNA repair ATPase RecN
LSKFTARIANQNLLEPARQLALLDAFGSYPPEILGNVAKCWNDLLRYTKELEEEQTFIARSGHEQPQIEKIINELNRLGMRKGFYEEYLGRISPAGNQQGNDGNISVDPGAASSQQWRRTGSGES